MSKILLVIATFTLAVFLQYTAFAEQESNTRKTLDTAYVVHPIKRTDPPVLTYECGISHHGIIILEPGSNLVKIFVWKDGMIVWGVRSSNSTLWYQTTIPVEKVEAAVQEIAENYAEYPVKDRPTWTSIILSLGASFSPSIAVYSSHHYESFGMEKSLREFYMKNQEVFQSDNEEAILETIKSLSGGLSPGKIGPNGKYIGPHPMYMFDFQNLVAYYREKYPQGGLAEKGTEVYSNEELLKCAALYTADVEHLLFAEKTIIDLLPSKEGIKPKYLKSTGRDFIIEYETKDGKTEFFYKLKVQSGQEKQ